MKRDEDSAERRLFALCGTQQLIPITMNVITAVTVIAHLQLALRHPQNTGISSLLAANVRDQLIDALSRGDDEIEEFLRRGDDPQYDVRR